MATFGTAAVGAVIGAFERKAIDVVADPWLDELLSRDKKPLELLEDEIFFLRKVLPKLKEVIWSAEAKDETAEMRRALQGFVDDAEDILDEYDMQTAQLDHSNDQVAAPGCNIFEKVSRLTRSPSDFADQIKGLYDRLEKVKGDVDKRHQFLASAKEGLGLAKKEVVEGETRRPTRELLRKNFRFVGRDRMKEEIMAELLSEPLTSEVPTVVLVTGMGGVGKTTLVQDIFRQRKIAEHFSYKKWVCVGDELDLKVVTGAILGNDRGDVMEIHSKLESKRFLIVLDDCWSGKLKCWNDLWDVLTYGSEGSKVLVTSREDISSELLLASVKKYELGVLSDEECLQIFESYAFQDKKTASSSSSTSRLHDNEKRILNEKIKGLPLAATVLGSSLMKVGRDKWTDVLKGVAGNDIMSVLIWSYRRLPWYLKQCFAYLSVFPKDYKLQKEQVVWMWIAHNYVYVQPEDNQAYEDIGKHYFDDLVRASLIRKTQDDEKSDVYYNMHDLIHDLAMDVSKSGSFPYNHLSITDNKTSHEYFESNKKLRTLLDFCKNADITKLQLRRVRVLVVSGEQHLGRIDCNEMIHLRYLDITKVEAAGTLSESICNIYNLQTLLLNNRVGSFPLGAWNLPSLHHLIGGGGIRMTGISNSMFLHTITSFNLFHEGEDIKELANLKELRGKLEINNLSHVKSPQFASEAQLDNKKYIKELVLDWENHNDPVYQDELNDHTHRVSMVENQTDILENLRPQQSLRALKISSYMGDQLPSWMSGNYLLDLVELELSHLHHVVELPPLGHLPLLEHLHLCSLKNVQCIGNELFYGTGSVDVFPSLKRLKLEQMDGLKEWKESNFHGIPTCFPSLERLEISSCKMLRSMPRHFPRNLKKMIIKDTGLEALPEARIRASTDEDREYCFDIHCLEELVIRFCPSLRLDEWFRRHRMPSLRQLELYSLDGCANLVINYSRKCLERVDVHNMSALESITLSNISPLDESGEADHPRLSITLISLPVFDKMSMVNNRDGKITAGPLELRAWGWEGAAMVVENLAETMRRDEEYAVRNAVDCPVSYILRVTPLVPPSEEEEEAHDSFQPPSFQLAVMIMRSFNHTLNVQEKEYRRFSSN